MKIPQKYQLPVVIAACLHGALLLSVPAVPPMPTTNAVKPPLLSPVPPEIIQMLDTNIVEDTGEKAGGGRANAAIA